jgi:hypothetical protein
MCIFIGSTATIGDSKSEVAMEIFEAYNVRNLNPAHSLWRRKPDRTHSRRETDAPKIRLAADSGLDRAS